MSAIPRYVSTASEAAARIAGYIFGDGNPDVLDSQLGEPVFTCIATAEFQAECQRCAGVVGWLLGTHYRIANNGNFKVTRSALYAALGITSATHDMYHRALEPTVSYTPTRIQIQAFLASVIETEGSFSTNPPKVFDEARGGVYDQRIDALILTLNTQSLGAFRSGVACKVSLAALDAFPLPLITAARYPGDTPADWPEDTTPPPPDTTPPPVPVGVVGVAGDASATVVWDVVVASDLAGYRVFRDAVQVYQGTVPSLLEVGLSNGVTYSYTVASYDLTGNQSAQSAAASVTPQAAAPPPGDSTPPSAPSGLTGTPSATQISLSWTASASTDVASYRLYRGSTLLATILTPSTSYVDSGLVPDTTYTYRVSAVDTSGNESASTAFISASTLDAPVDPPLITTIPIKIVSTIGCADSINVFVADRSGWPVLVELPQTGGDWSRVTDEISELHVQMDLSNRPLECCEILAGLVEWGYELVVFRDGVRIWTGPLVDIITEEGGGVTLNALDKMGWLTVRPIWSALSYPEPGEEMATIFNDIVTNAMAPDSVPGLVATATATGIRAVREYTTNPPQVAFDAIQELARTGVDYTMIGPDMVAGSFIIPASPIALITEQALAAEPQVPRLGANRATQWVVTGDPDENLLATYGGVDPVVGLVVRIATEDDIRDQESLDQNAKSRWELTSTPQVTTSTLVLDPSAPLPLELAIPGAVVDLRLAESCFPVVGPHRLKSVNGSWSAGEDGLTEKISISVEPVGTELVE